MPIDHVMIKVGSWEEAKRYYSAAIKPLGYEPVADWGTGGGFGVKGDKMGNIYMVQEENPGRIHFAISAPSAEAVSKYHSAAVAAGGKDNGAPGHRAHYPEGGVGCFCIDPWNNNIEVAFRP